MKEGTICQSKVTKKGSTSAKMVYIRVRGSTSKRSLHVLNFIDSTLGFHDSTGEYELLHMKGCFKDNRKL